MRRLEHNHVFKIPIDAEFVIGHRLGKTVDNLIWIYDGYSLKWNNTHKTYEQYNVYYVKDNHELTYEEVFRRFDVGNKCKYIRRTNEGLRMFTFKPVLKNNIYRGGESYLLPKDVLQSLNNNTLISLIDENLRFENLTVFYGNSL